jgi:AraC-like DNA-binding protein
MRSVIFKDIKPSNALEEYVRKFQIFRFVFDTDVRPPVKFHTPRPEHSITFYVRDQQKFSHLNSDSVITYPRCIINGVYTNSIFRYGGHDFWALKIVLQPTFLSRLKCIPISELTNNFINAEDVLGKEVSITIEKLCLSDSLDAMIIIIENFLINIIKKKNFSFNPFDRMCNYILKLDKNVSSDWLADQSCLSARQFIRKFESEIGIRPKTFQKLIRIEKAFRMKNNFPESDWLNIAIACGYYDYQHLTKDFREFTSLSPTEFYEIEKKSPERTFGFHEG